MKTLTLVFLMSAALPMVADTTFDESAKFAWGSNAGWISFRHDRPSSPAGIVFGGAFLSGFAYSANLGWIHFGSGNPANGHTYSNAGSDHGVNHDGAGNLSGYAWSANTGWINFGWASPVDENRPRVDLLTGVFHGYAWGANTGWINLGTGLLTTRSMSATDSDGDGIPDWWEMSHFGNLVTAGGISDADGDGFGDLDEFIANTNPNDPLSHFRIVSHSHDLSVFMSTLEFTTVPSRLYRIDYSNDLGMSDPWDYAGNGIFAPDTGATTTRMIRYPEGPRKFFRVVSIVPLRP